MPRPPESPLIGSTGRTDAVEGAVEVGVPVARVVVVDAEGCHFCADAQAALADLADHYPLRVEVVDARSSAGQALLAAYRPAMNPLVLLDGAFFSQGRLPRRKLAKVLAQRVQAGGRRG